MVGEISELHRLLRNRHLSPSGLRALQERKLRAVVRQAYEKVPYYGDLFRSAGIVPADIRTLEDLRRVPITTKENLRAAGLERIIAEGTDPSHCHKSRTTGTTGKPFDVYRSLGEAGIARLLGFRTLLSVGFRPWDRFCQFWDPSPSPMRLHQRLGLYREERIPPLLPPDEQIHHLRRIRPTVLSVWPSVLRALLHQVDYRLSGVIRPRVLITNGEVLDQGLKRRIQADMDVEMFDAYGASEFGEIAAECRAHEGLHVNADQVIVECLGEDGQPTEPEAPGVVVFTSLYSFTMPFIRYRLGDICTWLDRPCSCGSSFPLIGSLLGRQQEVIRLPSGKVLPYGVLWFRMIDFEGIDQYRVIQEDVDHLVVQLVPQRDLGEETLSQIRAGILERLREPVRVDIQIVDNIPEEKLKFREFISRLPPTDEIQRQGRA